MCGGFALNHFCDRRAVRTRLDVIMSDARSEVFSMSILADVKKSVMQDIKNGRQTSYTIFVPHLQKP
jgi:hypothetical protein